MKVYVRVTCKLLSLGPPCSPRRLPFPQPYPARQEHQVCGHEQAAKEAPGHLPGAGEEQKQQRAMRMQQHQDQQEMRLKDLQQEKEVRGPPAGMCMQQGRGNYGEG